MRMTTCASWEPIQAWPSYDVIEAGARCGSSSGPPRPPPVFPFMSVTAAGFDGPPDTTHSRYPSLESDAACGISTLPQWVNVSTSRQVTAPPDELHQMRSPVVASPAGATTKRFVRCPPVRGLIRITPDPVWATRKPAASVIVAEPPGGSNRRMIDPESGSISASRPDCCLFPDAASHSPPPARGLAW